MIYTGERLLIFEYNSITRREEGIMHMLEKVLIGLASGLIISLVLGVPYLIKLSRKRNQQAKVDKANTIQKVSNFANGNDLNSEESFLSFLEETKSSAEILNAWQQFNLASKYPKVNDLIIRYAKTEKKSWQEPSEFVVSNEKQMIRSLIKPNNQ